MPKSVTLLGITMPVSDEQPLKQSAPMVSRVSGRITLARFVHLLNAELPIDLTGYEISTVLRRVQFSNALLPIVSTVLGK